MEDDNNDAEEDLTVTCIHWGYLNVMQASDNAGKKLKHFTWQTFWTDLCGSTLRLYKDTCLPTTCDFPPSTMIGPRPEEQIKHSFFCLKNGIIKDFDYGYAHKHGRKQKIVNLLRKNMLQIILPDHSVYFLQAPTMSALYRWRTKIQASIDHADAPEKHYEKQLRDAKMASFQRQRCYMPPEPVYPEAPKPTIEEEHEICIHVPPPIDPRIVKLKEKILENRRLLRQLERQERDFLGTGEEEKSVLVRIEFQATAKQNYYLVPGRRETLITAGQSFTVFGQLPNGRWRCSVDRHNDTGTSEQDLIMYPMIGCVPSSVIAELGQSDKSVSSEDTISDISLSDFLPSDTLNNCSPNTISSHLQTETDITLMPPPPMVNHTGLPTPPPMSTPNHSPQPSRPTQLLRGKVAPGENLDSLFRRLPLLSGSSLSPTSPENEPQTPTQTVDTVMSDLNDALGTLSLLRTRGSSNASTASAMSTSSREDEPNDMCRGSRLTPVAHDSGPTSKDHEGVVRRKKRDIYITRKLHAKGISLIVGSSSSSEDEDDETDVKNVSRRRSNNEQEKPISRKIEELHVSKEKLTEKNWKVPKPTENTPVKTPTGDRSINVLDKLSINNDILREFSENNCYGLPVRNSVIQTQFKPLASHEIPPPLHQRRTLQMTRKENEGFGFVLQTYSVVQAGAYNDSMTFVWNVSEDGPAYLAGMRPGDVIMEVENVVVEDYEQNMIVDSVEKAGVSVRLVVIYKDAMRLMKLATRLTALKARLKEAEAAREEIERKEKMVKDGIKDSSLLDKKVRVAMIYIHIQTSCSTFARDSPRVKYTVTQNKRTPTELLQAKTTPLRDISELCGAHTTGYEIAREFASSYETTSLERQTPSPKHTSETSPATPSTKRRKTSEHGTKSRTIKQTQRSSFISYVDVGQTDIDDSSRRRVKSEGNEPEEELSDTVALTQGLKTPVRKRQPLTNMPSIARPESYMFAVGTNSVSTLTFTKPTSQTTTRNVRQ